MPFWIRGRRTVPPRAADAFGTPVIGTGAMCSTIPGPDLISVRMFPSRAACEGTVPLLPPVSATIAVGSAAAATRTAAVASQNVERFIVRSPPSVVGGTTVGGRGEGPVKHRPQIGEYP